LTNNQTTLKLLDLENLGSIIWIVGTFILIIAATNSKKILLETGSDLDPSANYGPDVTTFNGRLLWTIANFLASVAATARLMQRQQNLISGKPIAGSLIPNWYIAIGLWISFIGTYIALIGDKKRVEETVSGVPVE